MKDLLRKDGCTKRLEDIMKNIIKLTPPEILEISSLIQRLQALLCVRKILDISPDRIDLFGLKWEDFSNLDEEIEIANSKCHLWWQEIAEKYDIPLNTKFTISYADLSLTIEE